MNVFTIEVAWGERLSIEIGRWEKRTGLKRTDLYNAVCAATECTRNTISKLVKFPDEPAKAQDRQRAYVLLAGIEADPTDFGIDADDVPARLLRDLSTLPEHMKRWMTITADGHACRAA